MSLSDERRTCASCGHKFSGFGNVCPRCGEVVPHSAVPSSPAETESARRYGFTDLHGFKDYVGFVKLCAPDSFPEWDWAPQETLETAFEGLRYGLTLSESQGANPTVIAKCRELMQYAYEHYKANRMREGFFTMKEMQKTINRLPSQ